MGKVDFTADFTADFTQNFNFSLLMSIPITNFFITLSFEDLQRLLVERDMRYDFQKASDVRE
jgi:hypothetical protein